MDFRDRACLDLTLTLRELEELHDALTYTEEVVADHDCSGLPCQGCSIQRISTRVLELIEASVNEAAETNTWKHVGGAQ